MSRSAWTEIGVTVGWPTLVLVLASDIVGPGAALVVGLLPPLVYAVTGIVRDRAASPMAVLAVVGLGASGGLGLVELDTRWFAWKEAALGVLFGVVTIASAFTRWSVCAVLLERLFDGGPLRESLERAGGAARYARALRWGTIGLGLVTVASAAVTYTMAGAFVRSPTGTADFAKELGAYTGWSFAGVTLPSLVLASVVLRWVLGEVEVAAGRPWDELLAPSAG